MSTSFSEPSKLEVQYCPQEPPGSGTLTFLSTTCLGDEVGTPLRLTDKTEGGRGLDKSGDGGVGEEGLKGERERHGVPQLLSWP